MNRRGFFGRFVGAVTAAFVAPKLITLGPPNVPLAFDPKVFRKLMALPPLEFHPNAFAMTMSPLNADDYNSMIESMRERYATSERVWVCEAGKPANGEFITFRGPTV